jgi:tryptophanyl-tRNA synthetase
MRPTGAMHLGHYHGALKNWVRLQNEHECFFFVADWHALTTHYEEREVMERYVYDMVVDWIAAGLDPEKCTIFIQSRLPEHAELFTLLAMGTPLGWLERVPTYKDQIDKLKDRDLATYGFLGYPLLQAADILIYKANYVPVGEDQSSHVELTREVARRFNNLYGRSKDFEARIAAAMAKLCQGRPALLRQAAQGLRRNRQCRSAGQGRRHREEGRRSIEGWTEKTARPAAGPSERQAASILTEPRRCTPKSAPARPGRHQDEQELRQRHPDARHPASVRRRSAAWPPTRSAAAAPTRRPRQVPGVAVPQALQRRSHPKDWVVKGCKSAGIGCLDCKQPVIDAIVQEQEPWRERAEAYLANPKQVHWIVEMGTERARTVARQTMKDVRDGHGPELRMRRPCCRPSNSHPARPRAPPSSCCTAWAPTAPTSCPWPTSCELAAVGPVRWVFPRAPVRR